MVWILFTETVKIRFLEHIKYWIQAPNHAVINDISALIVQLLIGINDIRIASLYGECWGKCIHSVQVILKHIMVPCDDNCLTHCIEVIQHLMEHFLSLLACFYLLMVYVPWDYNAHLILVIFLDFLINLSNRLLEHLVIRTFVQLVYNVYVR